MTDLRIVVPAAAAWLGAIVLLPFPGLMLPVALGCWVLALGMLVAARMRGHPVLVMLGVSLAAVALVATAAFAGSDARRPAALRGAHDLVAATVVTTQTVTHASTYFAATLTSANGHAMSVPVLVFGASPAARMEIGTALRVSGTLQATAPNDEDSYLVFASGPAHFVSAPAWYLGWADALRAGLAHEARSLPGVGAELLPGLAIGDTAAVSPALNAAMKTSSLSHLTAVSGANCAVIIGLIMLVGRALGLRRGLRIGLALVVLVGFVVLVTPQPSVVRSAIMAALVLGALAGGRPLAGLPVVGLTVLAMLTLDPWIATDYGFALSVLATAGLMAFAGPLAGRLRRWLPGWLAMLVAVPLAAQLACQPVLLLLNPSLPLYGVLANTLAEPASPVATVLGLVACVLLPVVPGSGHAIAGIAWVPATWIADVATFFAGLPTARIPWPGGWIGVVALIVATVLLLVVLLARVSGRTRGILAGVLVLAIVVPLAATGLANVVGRLGRPADWQIADCDIGQGDAMLVRSAGKVALMDTGPSAPLLTRCLDELGISRINLLVLSHYDLDHVAGTPAVDSMTDRALVGPSTGKPRDVAIIQGLLDGGTKVDRVSEGLTGRLGDLRWSVLWPPSPLPDGILPGNEACVTILFEPVGRCENGCLSSMFVGDLDEKAQDLMLAANPALPRLDVIEVSHHGSADQSPAMYQRVAASVGLIGVGLHNRYGHPTQHLLDILGSVGTLPARTDTEGLVLLKPGATPGTVSVWSEHPDTGGAGSARPGRSGHG
jgi:competence protein ComEC